MLVNKVAGSKLITFNLEDYYPRKPHVIFDIKDYLFRGLILREKDFRDALKTYDWTALEGKDLIVTCSVEAIIPTWAYMLIAVNANPYITGLYFGNIDDYITKKYDEWMAEFDFTAYNDALLVVKGCSNQKIPNSVYAAVTARLGKYAKSIMFGEACSTVPVYKRKNG